MSASNLLADLFVGRGGRSFGPRLILERIALRVEEIPELLEKQCWIAVDTEAVSQSRRADARLR